MTAEEITAERLRIEKEWRKKYKDCPQSDLDLMKRADEITRKRDTEYELRYLRDQAQTKVVADYLDECIRRQRFYENHVDDREDYILDEIDSRWEDSDDDDYDEED